MYKSILVAMALDHDISQEMLAFAKAVSEPGAKITALHVLEEPSGTATVRLREDLIDQGIDRAKGLFEKKLSQFPDVESRIVQGHVSRTIVEFAEETGADCIIMGSHKPGLVDYLIGSTAARVVKHAACSVHVYRPS